MHGAPIDHADPAAHAPASSPFDTAQEATVISGLLLRHAARLVKTASQPGIVAGLCEALTQAAPHLRLAWTWFGPNDAKIILPQIVAGAASTYAVSLVIDENTLTRNGPAFRALNGHRTRPFPISPSSPFEPWRRAADLHGIRSVLALPLHSTTPGHRGIFVLYADTPDYFDAVGVPLFEALAELSGALLSAAADRTALQVAAHSDALTGLGNRRAADDIERSVHRRNALAKRSTVVLMDIDHFKRINDLHGHRAGDQVLREVADHLLRALRRDDRVLRWGGEEFLVCLPGVPLARGLQVADKLRQALGDARFDEGRIQLTVSAGVAEIGVGMTLGAAIDIADRALYEAKRDGRNRVIAGPSEHDH